jgi:hypothetical protein
MATRDQNDDSAWKAIGDILHSFVKDLGAELGYAVDDIRHKVVEEGFHDRQTTGDAFGLGPNREAAEHNRMAEQRDYVRGTSPTVEELMSERTKGLDQGKTPEREAPDHER